MSDSVIRPKTLFETHCYLDRVFQRFIADIAGFDEDLAEALSQGMYFAGGCLASLLGGDKVNDFDMYFTSRELALRFIDAYRERYSVAAFSVPGYVRRQIKPESAPQPAATDTEIIADNVGTVGKPNNYLVLLDWTNWCRCRTKGKAEADSGDDDANDDVAIEGLYHDVAISNDKDGCRPTLVSPNAISLANRMQVVTCVTGPPEELLQDFDFSHCRIAYRPMTVPGHAHSGDRVRQAFTFEEDTLRALLAKELVVKSASRPLCSLVRMRKFIKRGYRINAGNIMLLAMAFKKLDLRDVNVLREQLLAVDAAYFWGLLRALDPEKLAVQDGDVTVDTEARIVSWLEGING